MKVKISLVVVLATLIGATWAFGDGFNMVSWPLIPHDTLIQPVFADSMGTGCQLTGSFMSYYSDLVRYYDASTSAWSTGWYNTTTGWQGDLTVIEADKGYWIQIRGAHPAVTLTMTGAVSSTQRVIPVYDDPTLTTYNLVGTAYAVPCSLQGISGDDAGLIASGFTGSFMAYYSDKLRHFDGTLWYTAWYSTSLSHWQLQLCGSDPVNHPSLVPGSGYYLEILGGHSFTNDEWIYPIPPSYSKGGKTVLRRETRVPEKREDSVQVRRLRNRGISTNASLAPEKVIKAKKTR
jgi:hypothetical protein